METIHNRNYGTIPIGIAVRRQLAHTYIYRVRHGNGFYNSKAGAIYQDRYTYVVPSSINNPEGQAARDALAAAVANWQGFTSDQKKVYNDRAAAARLRMGGYHLYIREYVRANA
jgi:hypothetical protein